MATQFSVEVWDTWKKWGNPVSGWYSVDGGDPSHAFGLFGRVLGQGKYPQVRITSGDWALTATKQSDGTYVASVAGEFPR